MSIKLSLLKTGEQLISEMKELVAEGQDVAHAYMLENPHIIEIKDRQFVTEEDKSSTIAEIKLKIILFIFILFPWLVN